LEEELFRKLEIFGLTQNQAKVYLTIIRAGSISVGKIAESSKLYRQDIYKIIPKLERKGVITKTLGTPIIVHPIRVKRALKTLVSQEKKDALERIRQMEANLEELSNAVSMMYETETRLENIDPQFTLLTQENEIMNEADLLYEKAKTECDIVASVKLLTTRASNFHERFLKATNNGAKIRLLIEAPRKDKMIEAAVERVRPDSDNFTAKLFICKSSKPFQIIDRKDVWISTSLKSKSGMPGVLWTNGDNIVAAYHERFERMWNNKKVNSIPSLRNRSGKSSEAVTAT
jgi:sugar-specific transcriptional regulator TrmB